jgi:hypothetical protein
MMFSDIQYGSRRAASPACIFPVMNTSPNTCGARNWAILHVVASWSKSGSELSTRYALTNRNNASACSPSTGVGKGVGNGVGVALGVPVGVRLGTVVTDGVTDGVPVGVVVLVGNIVDVGLSVGVGAWVTDGVGVSEGKKMAVMEASLYSTGGGGVGWVGELNSDSVACCTVKASGGRDNPTVGDPKSQSV